jgi:hypothetical protein
LISKGGEERRILVRASMMTLLVALDYKKVTPSVGEMGEGKDDNAFRYFVSKLVSHLPLGPPLGGTTLVPFEQSV